MIIGNHEVLFQALIEEARKQLGKITSDKTRYRKTLEGLIAQVVESFIIDWHISIRMKCAPGSFFLYGIFSVITYDTKYCL